MEMADIQNDARAPVRDEMKPEHVKHKCIQNRKGDPTPRIPTVHGLLAVCSRASRAGKSNDSPRIRPHKIPYFF